MRTTVDLPEELMRAAKATAAERGESLKELISRALVHEVGGPQPPRSRSGRVALPLIGCGTLPDVLITNGDIAAAFDADDVDRHGIR